MIVWLWLLRFCNSYLALEEFEVAQLAAVKTVLSVLPCTDL